MITKRNGHGQTECVGCKNKGKFALNWDCFLYTFNGEPYCLKCLLEMLDNLNEENQELKKQLEQYKGSHYCSFIDICKSTKIANYTQQKEFIEWLEDKIEECFRSGDCRELKTFQNILQKYKEITGVENDRD